MKNQSVVILTVGRSGSSAIAGALDILGIPMGENMGTPHPSNPKGPFEDRKFMIFSMKYLKSRGLSWYFPFGSEAFKPTDVECRNFTSIVNEKNAKSKVWGWKNPRTVTYIKFLGHLLPNPLYVWIYRSKEAFIKSLVSRDNVKEAIANDLYDYYMKIYSKFKLNLKSRLLEVDMNKFISNPEKTLREITTQLNTSIDEIRLKEAVNFVDPQLKHW